MVAKIALPRILRIGGGSLAEARDVLRVLGLKSPLIVTDPFLRKRGLARMLSESLSELGELRQLCTDGYEGYLGAFANRVLRTAKPCRA